MTATEILVSDIQGIRESFFPFLHVSIISVYPSFNEHNGAQSLKMFFINISYFVKQVKPYLCSLQSPKFNQ